MEVITKPQTFWQLFTLRPPEYEVSYYNPLGISVGSFVSISRPGFEGLDFRIDRVSEYKRQCGTDVFTTAVYDLVANQGLPDQANTRLFANPDASRGPMSFSLLLLNLDHEEEVFDEGLMEVIEDAEKTKVFIRQDEDENGVVRSSQEFIRLNDLDKSWYVEATVASDEDGSGAIDTGEIDITRLRYWDFESVVEISEGVYENQFMFIELDDDNGGISFWLGSEVDESAIHVL
jgi:hypothetical protein